MKGFCVIFSYLILIYCLFACGSSKGSSNHYAEANKKDIWIDTSVVDSIIFEKVKYKNGIKEGKAKMFLKSGNVAIGKYKSDKKNGAWKYYNKNKELFKIEYYTEGYLSRIEFYENSKVVRQAITDPTF